MKKCFKCLKDLPLSEFYKHVSMSDGHLNKCKSCTKNDVSKHRQDNLEYIREYDRMRSSQPHRLEKNKQVTEAWRVSHPKRRSAQITLGNAVRRGLVKKCPCMVCGAKAEAHHPDYDRPLDVVWLCRSHHMQAHALVHEYKKAA